MAFYGSSHTRTLFFHVYRLLAGIPFPQPLPDEVTNQAAGGSKMNGKQNWTFQLCDNQYSITIIFAFKSFYYMPARDEEFLDTVATKFGTPDLLFTEASIWSYYEKELVKHPRNMNMTLADEEEYFLNLIARRFANAHTQIVWAWGSGESPGRKSKEQFITTYGRAFHAYPSSRVCVLDKETLARPPGGMLCLHGCDGPVVMIQAQMILRSVLSRSSHQDVNAESLH
jgi:hypothetical protein